MKELIAIRVVASFILLAGDAFGEVYALVMKDGTVDHWESLIEKEDRYCVTFLGGEACIHKKNVIALYRADNFSALPPRKLVDPNSVEALRFEDLSQQEIDAIVFAKQATERDRAAAKIKVKLVEPKKTETPTRNVAPRGISRGSSSKKY